MVINISINSTEDVEHLTKEASKIDIPLAVVSDDGTISVDARSLLSLFALIGQSCNLVAKDSFDPNKLFEIANNAGVVAE